MKYKTSELEGALLDAAVAKAKGWIRIGNDWRTPKKNQFSGHHRFSVAEWIPSCIWDQGGPIIERERIEILCRPPAGKKPAVWLAGSLTGGLRLTEANTPLIAAMRAYVASKFGEDVELP